MQNPFRTGTSTNICRELRTTDSLIPAGVQLPGRSFFDQSFVPLWPPGSEPLTMVGQRRLDNAVMLMAEARRNRVRGHFIETGCWRGGLSFLVAKYLHLSGANKRRKVFLADS
mmetsp:Transcript_12743/g.17120  ORF Transcript_12743/g.17120 Transcript_12743/m.17120 type:complete len:113 (+) Transcript_12743:2130-2468(+)